MLALAAPALGATIPVDTTVDGLVDDGHCGLREAVAAANGDAQPFATPGECVAGSGADTITIPAGSYAMNTPAQPLNITSDMSLNGAGAATTSLGGASNRVVVIGALAPPVVTIQGLTIQDGHAPSADSENGVSGADSYSGGGSVTGPNAGAGGQGGGIFNSTGGALTILDSAFANNHGGYGGAGAAASGGNGFITAGASTGGVGGSGTAGNGGNGGNGGAIYSAGPLVVRDTTFTANAAGDGGAGGAGTGGDAGNGGTATGPGPVGGNGRGGNGGDGGAGGSIFATAAVTLERTSFLQSFSGRGGAGGGGQGGAGGYGGGAGGAGGAAGNGTGGNGGSSGGGGAVSATALTVSASLFDTSAASFAGAAGDGTGGSAGTAFGSATGGFGGSGTGGGGGSVGDGAALRSSGSVDIVASTFTNTQASAAAAGGKGQGRQGGTGGASGGHGGTGGLGTGGHGGAASRGAIFAGAGVTLVNSTMYFASIASGGAGGAAHGGNGGTGSGGTGAGGSALGGDGGTGGDGAAHATGTLEVRSSTLASVFGSTGGPGGSATGGTGTGGGFSTPGGAGAAGAGVLFAGAGGSVAASIIGGGGSPVACVGAITDGGHNLSPQATCPGSVVNPMLAALADNGGPTPTMALNDGSPALDALPPGPDCPASDQRGVTRPHGAACDIGAFERAAPDVATGAVDGLDTTTATLHGTVTPNGRATIVHFAYGTTTAYGASTPDHDAGAAVAPSDVAASLTGLAPGATYHYRLEGSSADGSTVGEDRTFTTPTTSGGGGGGSDTTAPVFLAASMTPTTFAVNRGGRRETPVAAAKHGTRLGWRLSEDARIVFAIARAAPGRRAGKRCAKPTRANAKRKRCTRYVLVGRFATDAKAGAGSKRFSGRIGRKTLRPGRHRVTLLAKDAAGNPSAPKRLRFRIVRG